MSNKRILRRRMKSLRREQSVVDNAILSEQIKLKLMNLECVRNANCIMAYFPHQGEVDLREFMSACMDSGKCVALPAIVHHGVMIAVQYTADSKMHHNIHGIEEPKQKIEIDPYKIDIVIVPALVLGEDLHRIGYGGGYYDRFLKKTHAKKIGVGFDFQIVPHLPRHTHDVPLDIVVSEKRAIGALPCV
jgi:5-formyltetrahydrofolate cyclo-ligase